MRQPALHFASSEFFRPGRSQVEVPVDDDGSTQETRWTPARPSPFHYVWPMSLWMRLRLAVGVFTGRYDALKWDGGQ